MYITLYFIVTRLPDSLRAVRDHFLALDPADLTVDLLEKHLLATKTSVVAVGAARGTPRTPFFERCAPSPLAPSYASAAAVDIIGAEDVGAASALSGKRRSSKGKGGRSGGGGGGSGGGGGGGGGGSGASGGGSGGFGGGGGGSSGGGGGGSGSSGSGVGGSGGGRVGAIQRGVDIFTLVYDAILGAMYALSVSAEGDCYLCVLPDPGMEAAALGASESSLSGTAPAKALHTFTLNSGASRCFFRDSTTLTPLPSPVPVRLADPSGGPVLARSSTVLLSLAVLSGSLSCLHLPSFSTNLVSTAALQDVMVTTTTHRGQRVSICTCTRTGRHLATFIRRPGSSLYALTTKPPQVAASAKVSASGPVAAPCSCRLLSHQTLLWHDRLSHPSLPHLRGMHSRLLISSLPRSLPSLLPSPAPPCLPCVEGRQRTAPHSSLFPPTTAPLQTLHRDVWGPARVSGQDRECYFLLVVDDYTRYTTVFPLRNKGEVPDVLIPWIRAVRFQLRERFSEDLPVLRLHSDKGGKFSDLLRDFCRGESILQSFTLPASPQQNGVAERRIGLVMEVARTSMIHAAAPCFLWSFAVRLAMRRCSGSGDLVPFSAILPRTRSPPAIPCFFLGFPPDAPGWQFYHPTSRCLLSSWDVTFDKFVPFYRLFPYRHAPLPPPAALPCSRSPSGRPPPPSWSCSLSAAIGAASGVVASGGTASGGAEPASAEPEGAELGGAESEGAGSKGVEPGGAECEGAESGGAELWGADPGAAEHEGAEPGGTKSEGAKSGGAEPRGYASAGGPAGASPQLSLRREPLSPQQLPEWFAQRTRLKIVPAGAEGYAAGDNGAGGTRGAGAAGPAGARSRGTRATGAGGVGGTGAGDPGAGDPGAGGAGAGGTGAGGAGAGGNGAGGVGARGTRAGDSGAGDSGAGGTGAGGAGAGGAGAGDSGAGGTSAGGAGARGTGAVGTGARGTGAGDPGAGGAGAGGAGAGGPGAGGTVQRHLFFVPPPPSSLPPPDLVLCQVLISSCLTCRAVRIGRRVPRPRPPPVPSTHIMALHPSSVPLRVPLPPPPTSSLSAVPDPEFDLARFASPTVPRLLATVVTDPSFDSTAASALFAELVDFAAPCCLDYATSLNADSESDCPPSVRGDCALGTDVVEDRQEDFECLAAAVPHLVAILLAPEGDPYAPDIPTPRSYAEAITVYGLRQAPREWHDTLRTTLAALGFAPSTADPSLFLRTNTSLPPFYVLVYVDDLVLATAVTEALALVKSELQKRHTCTDLGELRSYLGLQITRDIAWRTITLTQSHMVHQVHQRFGFRYSSPQSTPLPTGHLLSAPPLDESVEPNTDQSTGRLLRGCCATSGMGLVFGGRGPVVLTGHADASWVEYLATQRSSQGYTFSLGSGSVSWRSTHSSSILSSSCEVEIYAMAMAAQELRWLTYLLTELGERPRSSLVLYVDNKAMIALCQQHRLEHRTKHIALRYFLSQELQQRGQLCLAYVATGANNADIFTKALQSDPLPPQVPAPSAVSQVDPLSDPAPVQVAVGLGAARGAASRGAASGGAEPAGAESEGAETRGAEPEGAESTGAAPGGVETGGGEPRGAEPEGVEPRDAASEGAESGGAEPQDAASSGGSAAGGTGVAAGAGVTGGTAASSPGGACTRGTGAAGIGGVEGAGAGDPTESGVTEAGGFGAGGTRAGGAGVGGTGAGGAGVGGTGVGGAGAGGAGAVDPGGAVRPRPYFVPLLQQVLDTLSSTSLTPPLLCPPPDQSQSSLQPASPLPAPSPYTEQSGGLTERRKPASSPVSPVRTARRVPRLRPPPIPGTHAMTLRPSSVPLRVPLPSPLEFSLLEVPDPESDRARAASPTVSCLLATAVTDPSFESTVVSALVDELLDFSAACRLDYATALVAESASASPPSVGGDCALGTDVFEDTQEELQLLYLVSLPCCLPLRETKMHQTSRPRALTQRRLRAVDYFHTFSPTPKMTTLWVLLHVAAQRDYELHSLEFSTAFLHGSLHEEIWLRRPPGFTYLFPAGNQWSLRRPVYGLRQAPRERHDTLRTTLAALGFAPATGNPSLFLRTDTSLPPFYVLVYVDDLVFATADTEALTLVLQHFGFQFSSPQPTPLSTSHSLSAPPSDESVEPSGPYPELVGWLMYLMTCTRPDLAYPLSLLAHYVAPGRHRKVHWDAAKRVLRYLCSTSGMGLVLGGRGPVVLTGHADASWFDASATQRSSHGNTFSLGSGSVSWRSTRSSSVLSSSCEAEIYVEAMAAQELRWLTYLLTNLGEQPHSPLVLYVENKAMIALCQEHRLEHRTKHIALRYFLALELQQRGQLRLAYVSDLGFESQYVHFGHPSAGVCQRSTGDPRLILGKGYRLVVLGGYGRTDPLLNKPFYPNGQVVGILICQGVGDVVGTLFVRDGVAEVFLLSGGAKPGGAEPGSAEPGGEEPGGAGSTRVASRSASSRRELLSPQELREWFARRWSRAAGAGGTPGAGGTGGAAAAAGVGPTGASGAAGAGAASGVGVGVCPAGGTAGAAGGTGAAGPAGVGAAGASGAPGVGAAEGVGVGGSPDAGSSAGAGVGSVGAGGAAGTSAAAGGTGAVPAGSGDPARPRPYFVPLLEQVLGLPPSSGPAPSLECPQPVQSQSLLHPVSPLPAPSPYSGPTGGLAERREPASRPALPVRAARTSGHAPSQRPPAVPRTHQMALRPSTASQRVPLPSPPASSLPVLADPESASLRAASPTVARLLSTVVTDPSFASAAASALVAELVDFAAYCRLDYAAGLVAESASVCPPSVGGECALSTDVLEDRQEEFQCFAAALPHLVSMLIAPEVDPDAPDIPTPRSYAEAIEGPYSSQWQSVMDAEMASWKVKRPPGSPPVFKARYVARGFRQRQGVDYFQTFSPTPKMTTLRVLLHVAAQRDYELHSLDFSTAFLQGSLHEEIWLRRPPSFTGSFPPGTDRLRGSVHCAELLSASWAAGEVGL
ncbi:unnamed protein product [Closterium sp. NIES-54]